MRKCTLKGCPGHYEKKLITHTVKLGDRIIVIESVPAEVCSVCGDTLLSLEVVKALEKLMERPGEPVGTAPIYEMPKQEAA